MALPFGINGATISKNDDGQYPAQVDGYPVIYYTHDGLTVCAGCASKDDTSDDATGADFYYEGPTVQCDDCGCGCDIESAYGDPEETEGKFIATLQANSDAWKLADFGTMDTVIRCLVCGHYEVCSDREAAIFVMTEAGCSACEMAV